MVNHNISGYSFRQISVIYNRNRADCFQLFNNPICDISVKTDFER